VLPRDGISLVVTRLRIMVRHSDLRTQSVSPASVAHHAYKALPDAITGDTPCRCPPPHICLLAQGIRLCAGHAPGNAGRRKSVEVADQSMIVTGPRQPRHRPGCSPADIHSCHNPLPEDTRFTPEVQPLSEESGSRA
jgi:hypothetical protein